MEDLWWILWRNLLINLSTRGPGRSRTDRFWRPCDWTAEDDQRGSDRRWRSGVRREEDDQTCGLRRSVLVVELPRCPPPIPFFFVLVHGVQRHTSTFQRRRRNYTGERRTGSLQRILWRAM